MELTTTYETDEYYYIALLASDMGQRPRTKDCLVIVQSSRKVDDFHQLFL
jgi:hypothetical protein